ncbi:hypothetical protein S245_036800 [Arachis hypogaea]
MRGSSVVGDPVMPPPPMAGKKAAPVAEEDDARSKYEEMMEMKMVVRHKDLKEIVEAIKERFDKAAVTGDQVSEMLQISQAQLDRSFKQLRSLFSSSYALVVSVSLGRQQKQHDDVDEKGSLEVVLAVACSRS